MKIPATIFVSAANLSPWFSSATRTKWYPTLNLLRQGRRDNWKIAISEVSSGCGILARSTDYDSSSAPSALMSRTNSLHETATRHLREGQISAGIELLKRIIQLEPTFSAAHLDLGVALYSAWRFATGPRPLSRDCRTGSALSGSTEQYFSGVFDRKEFTEAERFLRQCMEQFPEVYDFKHRYGLTLMMLGRYGEAIEYLQQAASLRPQPLNSAMSGRCDAARKQAG